MPKAKKCTPCLNQAVKELVQKRYPDMAEALAKIPDCPEEVVIELCMKKGRASTPRMAFMKQCLKGQNIAGFADAPRAMKACSAEWREKQGRA